MAHGALLGQLFLRRRLRRRLPSRPHPGGQGEGGGGTVQWEDAVVSLTFISAPV